mmetsp:Transcript_65716/g.155223  ORF Transcript_65716/g.155223 Transcript_65716/m.155223 type:complete len:344 (+) Transcript_65716:2-1033(+)
MEEQPSSPLAGAAPVSEEPLKDFHDQPPAALAKAPAAAEPEPATAADEAVSKPTKTEEPLHFKEEGQWTINPLFKGEKMEFDDEGPDKLEGFNQAALAVSDWKQFLTEPAPEHGVVYCKVTREKSGLSGWTYRLFLEQGAELGLKFLLGARKHGKSRTANFHVWCDENPALWTSKSYFGKIREAPAPTKAYCFYDGGNNPERRTAASTDLRREFGAVMVEQGSQGGPHKLTAIMPGIGQQRRPTTSKESILEDYRLGRTASCLLLRSKEARWSEEQGIYCLKFKGKGRVKIASAKNFMLVTPSNEDFVYVQFGKQDETTFSLDFRAPLCPFQAFAIAVAAFDQ